MFEKGSTIFNNNISKPQQQGDNIFAGKSMNAN